jgi:predicted ArsR family transcriptional regulator
VADPTISGPPAARHRALADKSRLAILRVLQGADAPLDVPAIAGRIGLHENTVRWHLGVLLEAGLVSEERLASTGRGRPPHVYRLVEGALADQPGGYRLLAEVLVSSLEGRRRASELVEEAGYARGRSLVASPADGRRLSAKEAIDEVVRLLAMFGFQPELKRERGGQRIDMTPCPFGETAVGHAAIVCPIHLGLMRGVLDTLDAPVEATSLEPFVRPGLCLAHLRPRERRPHTRAVAPPA